MAKKWAVPLLTLLLLCLWLEESYGHGLPLYKDSAQPVEARVEDLLSRMTLQEKIGQMTQIERTVASAAVVKQYLVGSVLSVPIFSDSPAKTSASKWDDLVDTLQGGATSTRLGIPIIYGIDAVHGHNNVYGATIYPHNVGLGATRDPELIKKIGEATALEVRATGIPYVFAPCVAVCRDPRWGRCYESYGEDPNLVKSMTTIIEGLQGEAPASGKGKPYVGGRRHVAACAKHFVGDGGTTKGINENNTVASYADLVRIHMAPYFDAISKGVSTIMISYSSWNGVKMHTNQFLITHVLKKQLNFQGFVISDFQGIDKITDPPDANYTFSVHAAINAGIDMVMVGYDYPGFIGNLTYLIKVGDIKMKRINDAVRRILRVKFISGLFEHPKSYRQLSGNLGIQSHRDLAREAVRKSLVLLKNGKKPNQPLLPLSKSASKILVAGSHANDIGNQCGGWTMTWQGISGNITTGTTILQAIQHTVSSSTNVVYQKSPNPFNLKNQKFDLGIVVVGEAPYAESLGDNLNLTIPLNGSDAITSVCRCMKCLVVLISGRPLVMEPYLPLVDAFVAAWLPGTEGQGVADVIFGNYDFTGKLSRTWFKNVDQLPMNVGDEVYDPLFPFGFGLKTGKGQS